MAVEDFKSRPDPEEPEAGRNGSEKTPISPSVVGLYISFGKDMPMVRREHVAAFARIGLEDDRYAVGIENGTYSNHRIPEPWRNITIISQEGIAEANAELIAQGGKSFEDSEARRNVVVAGITPEQLNALAEGNQSIWLGPVEIQVMKLAPPCNVPTKQYEKPGFGSVFEGRGGVRGMIVNSGTIIEGDDVRLRPPISKPKLIQYPFGNE